MKNKNDATKTLKIMAGIFLSIFLAYMTIWISLIDYAIRSVFVMVAFTILYYFFAVPILFKLDYGLFSDNMKEKYNIKIKNINETSHLWFFPSLVLGAGALVLVYLVLYYLNIANQFFGKPEFSDYFYMAKSLPLNIVYILIISVLLLTSIKIYFISKIESLNKESLIVPSLISTIITFMAIGLTIIIGILIYSVIGGILLGGSGI